MSLPTSTQFNPTSTQFNPISTQFNPTSTQSNPISTQFNFSQPNLPLAPLTRGWGGANQAQRANEDTYRAAKIGNNLRYFAVFDGHGAPHRRNAQHVADYADKNLHVELAAALKDIDPNNLEAVTSALSETIVNFDRKMRDLGLQAGSTATIVLIDDARNVIYQINVGDSRSLIYRPDSGQILSETRDHHPHDLEESMRIRRAGGYVDHARVQGSLALSRALGDYAYKFTDNQTYDPINGAVSAVPTIITTTKQPGTEIILTSDAPFEGNAYDNQSLVNLAQTISNSLDRNDPMYSRTLSNTMVRTIVPKTTDDTTVVHVTV
jgi:serine/threonine protein phosphatase PrpC